MSIYVERTDAAFNLQLKTFASKIGTYSTTLGLTPTQVATVNADSLFFDYVINSMLTMQTFAHSYTKYKHDLRHGHVTVLGALPSVPVLPTPPTAVTADIEKRFRALIQTFVQSPNYTLAIGKDLGIVGPANTFDPTTGKPNLSIDLGAGGHPQLHYMRGNFDGVEIWKDSGTGFAKLERITQTNYTDHTPLPTAKTAAVWQYKLIFLYKDEVVGTYSDIVSITVNG